MEWKDKSWRWSRTSSAPFLQAETEAGISYYQKILRRNVLLRRLFGEEMEYYIQVRGSNFLWWDLQRFIIRLKNFWKLLIRLCTAFSLDTPQSYCFQESGEYVPMLYEVEYFRNISTKIKTLQDLGEELANTNKDSSESGLKPSR